MDKQKASAGTTLCIEEPEILRRNTPNNRSAQWDRVKEAEYNRLVDRCQQLEAEISQGRMTASIKRIILYVFVCLGTYLSWLMEWVQREFFLAVAGVCIAVIAATVGVLWGRRSEGGEL